MSLKLETIRDSAEFDVLESGWNDLVLRAPNATPFHTWQWCRAVWRHLVPENAELELRVLRDNNGLLRGIAPMYVEPGTVLRPAVLRSLGTAVGDYGGFLIDSHDPGDHDPAVIESVLWDSINKRDKRWDTVELTSLSQRLPESLEHYQEWQLAESDPAYGVDLPADMDEYMRSLDRKTRENLRRRRKRAHKQCQVSYWSVSDRDELDDILGQFIDLQRQRFAARHHFGFFKNRSREAFFREVAHALLNRGWLDLHCMTMDGVLASAQFGMELNRWRFNYQIAMDERFSRHGPGMLLMYSSVEGAISRGIRRYDLLTGGGGYKHTLNAQESPRYDFTWTRRPIATKFQDWRDRKREQLEGIDWLRRIAYKILTPHRASHQ